jgi:hypothetical protein
MEVIEVIPMDAQEIAAPQTRVRTAHRWLRVTVAGWILTVAMLVVGWMVSAALLLTSSRLLEAVFTLP